MLALIQLLLKNKMIVFKAVCGLSVAFLICSGIFLHRQNKMLSERLETAYTNIEAYQDIVSGNTQNNAVLKLTVDQLKHSNDSLIQQLDSVISQNKIKKSSINTAATQTQIVYVNKSKGVQGDLIEVLKDSTYTDSIQYNDLTTVYYTIGKDTVDVTIDLQNTQYLITHKSREWKNKKKFFKRLTTLDFKKVWRYKYDIINTNDLIKTSDVRIVEITQ